MSRAFSHRSCVQVGVFYSTDSVLSSAVGLVVLNLYVLLAIILPASPIFWACMSLTRIKLPTFLKTWLCSNTLRFQLTICFDQGSCFGVFMTHSTDVVQYLRRFLRLLGFFPSLSGKRAAIAQIRLYQAIVLVETLLVSRNKMWHWCEARFSRTVQSNWKARFRPFS